MTPHALAVDILLAVTVLSCWLGALGILRMRNPYQALHYLAIPGIVGMGALTLAVFLQTGWSPASVKSAFILIVLIASNAVGTHAAARAFRAREKGHWEPDPGDPKIEFLQGRPSQ